MPVTAGEGEVVLRFIGRGDLGDLPAPERAAGHASGHARARAGVWSTVCRLLGAAGVAAAGAIHFQLWDSSYNVISVIGPLFLLDALGSWVLAVLLVGLRFRVLAALGIAVELGAIGGLAVASTTGLFGFRESGFGVGGQILAAYATESLAVLLLAASLVLGRRRGVGSTP